MAGDNEREAADVTKGSASDCGANDGKSERKAADEIEGAALDLDEAPVLEYPPRMLGFDLVSRPALWKYHLAKQSIIDLWAELEVWNAELRLLGRRALSLHP